MVRHRGYKIFILRIVCIGDRTPLAKLSPVCQPSLGRFYLNISSWSASIGSFAYRYTSFIPLYPLGAISEAFLSFYTLPPLSTLPYLPSSPFALTLSPLSKLLQHLPKSFGKALLRSEFGRAMLWRMAQAGIKSKARVQAEWSVTELARLVMFCIWWPCEWCSERGIRTLTLMILQRCTCFIRICSRSGAESSVGVGRLA